LPQNEFFRVIRGEKADTILFRKFNKVFHVIDNASHQSLGSDYRSTDILSLTGQASFQGFKDLII
jgi:hypothetical protein